MERVKYYTCEYGKELLGSIKGREYLDHLGDY
jgi:hypothetical protein